MRSQTTARFREAFRHLPEPVRHKAEEAFRLWRKDPSHPSLRFKPIHSDKPIYSVRVGLGWRAVGTRERDRMIWFWVGSHAEYDHLVSQL